MSERTSSQLSVRCSENNEEESTYHVEEDNSDVLFVEGNEADYDACKDEDALMERVWWLTKPPIIPTRTFVVPARRIQITKERLSPMIEKLETAYDILQDDVKHHAMSEEGQSEDFTYEPVSSFDEKVHRSCQKETKVSIPSCARTLNEFL